MASVVISPQYVDNDTMGCFLAGPILGTADWQSQVTDSLKRHVDDGLLNIFNPRRPQFTDLRDFDDATFFEQVDWEHHHIDLAMNNGIMAFWLANKTVDMPHRNYGLTTLYELGMAVTWFQNNPSTAGKLIVGIEPGFTNEKYLRYTISKNLPHVALPSSINELSLVIESSVLFDKSPAK